MRYKKSILALVCCLTILSLASASFAMTLLNGKTMRSLRGGCNGQRCNSTAPGCTSACLSTDVPGVYEMVVSKPYDYCSPKTRLQENLGCYDNANLDCGHWEYYADSACADPNNQGATLYAQGCK